MELGFTHQEVADVRLVFDLFDASKQGSVQLEDLRKALRLLGFKVSREKVQQIASDVQTPGSRDLVRGRTDFTAFLQVLSKLQGSSYDRHEEILQAFSYLDVDGDGYLSVDDLRACAGGDLSQAELEAMVAEANKTSTGRVSQQEFVEVMLRTTLFRTK